PAGPVGSVVGGLGGGLGLRPRGGLRPESATPQPARRLHLRAYPWEAGVVGQRMFVSVVPPEVVVADLAEFLAPREGMPWIDPAQWHLTLAFMASVPEARQDELIDRLGEA